MNIKLQTWKVPENKFTDDKKVTLRSSILSHSAGLTVHGFPGYAVDAPLPTLVQVLDGAKPANTPAIRVDLTPGSKWRYAGGGYTVMQQLMIDATGQSFPGLMESTVLEARSACRQVPTNNHSPNKWRQPRPPVIIRTARRSKADGISIRKWRRRVYGQRLQIWRVLPLASSNRWPANPILLFLN